MIPTAEPSPVSHYLLLSTYRAHVRVNGGGSVRHPSCKRCGWCGEQALFDRGCQKTPHDLYPPPLLWLDAPPCPQTFGPHHPHALVPASRRRGVSNVRIIQRESHSEACPTPNASAHPLLQKTLHCSGEMIFDPRCRIMSQDLHSPLPGGKSSPTNFRWTGTVCPLGIPIGNV